MPQGVKQVPWIPVEDECLQARLMDCAYVGGRSHRAKVAMLHELRPSCAWGFMEVDVGDLVQQCLHWVDSKAGELEPRSLGELRQGEGVDEVIHFGLLHIGAGGPVGCRTNMAWETWRARPFSSLSRTSVTACGWSRRQFARSAFMAEPLLRWCVAVEMPRVWVRDTARHFKGRALGWCLRRWIRRSAALRGCGFAVD